jgi:hypothetical protein
MTKRTKKDEQRGLKRKDFKRFKIVKKYKKGFENDQKLLRMSQKLAKMSKNDQN